MKFSEQWLREWTDPKVSTAELCQQLTMAGLEVDGVASIAPAFDKVVIGHAVQVEKHPDADRLRVCQIDVGNTELLQIVCGAANMRAGLKVPVAMIGAVLPGDFKITAAKLRGVPSSGMICSEKEIGLAETSDGIMELPENAPIGKSIREYLHLDDHIIEIGLTANRGDCLSLLGMAREVAVINQEKLNRPEIKPVVVSISDQKAIDVQAIDACMVYAGRIIKNVNNQAPTPEWMKRRLQRSGIRSISAIVDVTNYVLLTLGQPMHAFDLNKIHGDVTVRFAKDHESLTLLKEQNINLQKDDLVIADENGALALAGIMGGLGSSVTTDTTDIFLESAYFTPTYIAGKARRLGLHTDSSHRFERGVDPQLSLPAMEYATQLLQEIAGGEVGPISLWQGDLPASKTIDFPLQKIEQMLGISIPKSRVIEILEQLGFVLKAHDQALTVTVPSWRFDVSIAQDLVEEVIRIYGYDKVPSQLPKAALKPVAQPECKVPLSKVKQSLVARGYREAITYSFIDPKLHQQLFPNAPVKALMNPIASNMSVMRTSLIPGLLQALCHNTQRQQTRVRLFEAGRCFIKANDSVSEQPRLAMLAYGTVTIEHWSGQRNVDFFDIKGDLLALLSLTAPSDQFTFVANQDVGFLHPGQSASVLWQGKEIGYVGAIHPAILQALDIRDAVYVAEIDQNIFNQSQLPHFKGISKFPSIRRDLALLVDEHIPAEILCAHIKQAAGNLLQSVGVFDIYQGEKIATGKKSVALSLTLQDAEKTLTDVEVVECVNRVLTALQQHLKVQLRE